MPTRNSFAHLGQDDTSTHDSGRTTNADKEVGDVIGWTINAIRDAEEVAKRSTNADEDAKVESTPPARPTVLVPEDLHAAIDAVSASEHRCTITMIDYYRREFGEVRRELRSRMDTLNETKRTITQIIEGQHRASITMGKLATNLLITQQNLQDLTANKDARRTQMADHWQRMDALDLIIQEVDEHITLTVNQNLLLDAQMKGIHTTIKMAATAVHNNITNLRGCIIPDLCSASASLKSKVLELHNLSVSLKSDVLDLQEQVTTIKGKSTSTSPDHPPPALDETTPPLNPDGRQEPRVTSPSPPDEQASPLDNVPARSNATERKPPLNHWGQMTSPPVDNDLPPGRSDFHDSRPSHWSNTSWYHNDRNCCFDNPSGDSHRGYGRPSADRNHDGNHPSDYAPDPANVASRNPTGHDPVVRVTTIAMIAVKVMMIPMGIATSTPCPSALAPLYVTNTAHAT